MIEQGFELKNVKKLVVNSQSCKFFHLLNVSKLENSRKGDKSIWHILPPLTTTNLRVLQEVSMIYCYKR